MSSPAAQNQGPALFGEIIMLSRGYAPSACLYAAAKLKIADLLAGGPKPVSELARESRTIEDALYRTLRALASIDVFRETDSRTYLRIRRFPRRSAATRPTRLATPFFSWPTRCT